MKKEDFKEKKNYIELYQKVALSGYLCIRFSYKSDIESFNQYVLEYLNSNNGTDVRNSALTIYCEKINQFYYEKKKSFFTNLFSFLIVTGTFMMVIISFLSMNK